MKPIRNRGGICTNYSTTKTPLKFSCGNHKFFNNGNGTKSKKVQDPVEVFCRIRPLKDASDTTCISLYSATKVGFAPDVLKSRKLLYYTFSHVFTEHANQKEIFDHIAMPLLHGFLKGENGLLFSYGVTASGKTHTMCGEQNEPGIVPRCVYTIFNSIKSKQTSKYIIKPDKLNGFEVQAENEALMERLRETKFRKPQKRNQIPEPEPPIFANDGTRIEINENVSYTIFITYVEIYNNSAYDLLDENAGIRSLQSKILREDSRRNVYLNSVVELEVKSAEEALGLYFLGNQRKKMGTTQLNSESSRSHSIFTIRLVISPLSKNEDTEKSALTISQLSLVDLAGSERCNRTNTKGVRLKEAGSINNSLMALRTCLEILRDNQQTGQNKIVPYRDSRLTLLFKNYFEGEGNVKMIVCVNPSIKDLDETIHVMKFAEVTQEVKVARPEEKVPKEIIVEPTCSADEFKEFQTAVDEHYGKIPKVTLIHAESEEIQTLILYLKRRLDTFNFKAALKKHREKLRARIIQAQEGREKYDKELKYLLPAERARIKDLTRKLMETGVLLDKATEKCKEKDKLIVELQSTINEKEFKLKQNVLDKQKHKRKIEEVSEQMTHELDAKLRRQREHFAAAMKEKNEKIELVKDILTDKIPVETTKVFKDSPVVTPTDVQEVSVQVDENEAPILHSEERASTGHISRRSTPVANVRYRRSRSTGDVWLQHRPANPVPLGTVLQPMIKTRKSVTKLTDIKDVLDPKQSRYLLVSQTADDAGDLETKLFKGDIIPTCTGGAQVIFEDVEKLKQEAPSDSPRKLSRKLPNFNEYSAKKIKK